MEGHIILLVDEVQSDFKGITDNSQALPTTGDQMMN
jgi:hypothetical protein